MNTNMTTQPVKRSEKARERRQREQPRFYDENFHDDLYFCDEFSGLHTIIAKIFAERNSEKNKQKMYDYLHEFISKTPPTNGISRFQISDRNLYDGKQLYNTMKNDPEPNYEIFGSNGMGYTCFGLYKSNDKNIYIIVIDSHNNNTPTHYVKIENESIFG